MTDQSASISDDLLAIIVCPETRMKLRLAESELVGRVNDAIKRGAVHRRAGQLVGEPVDALLIREDNQVVYPVRDGIPVLLVDDAIALDQVAETPAG
ncbi:MAG: hypothetical protein R3C10_12465 [Pirellulales bacterium]|nr:hypothetical protein [Planctomycetales bacterium]